MKRTDLYTIKEREARPARGDKAATDKRVARKGRYPWGVMTQWRLEKSGLFPLPDMKLGRMVLWSTETLDAWDARRQADAHESAGSSGQQSGK